MNNDGLEVITCSKLDRNFIEKITITNNKYIVFKVKNTKFVDKNVLKYLVSLSKQKNLKIMVSIGSQYVIRDSFDENKKKMKFINTLYSLEELYEIITNFEEIESKIESNWDDFDKAIYFIDTLVSRVMYDPEYILMKNNNISSPKIVGDYNQADFYDRSLRGILSGKTICAGYASIFRELANRNGIKCEYVSGVSYSSSGIKLGGHAWNILNINGVSYPLDITHMNAKYRKGDFLYTDVLSCDIEKFMHKNRPYEEKYTVGLTKIPEDIIDKSRKKTSRVKKYDSMTYVRKRKDNSQFFLSQVGMHKGLYKYLYSEISADGVYSDVRMIFSESNLFKEITDNNYGRSDNYNEFIDCFDNILFSKENLNDSLINKRTNYIGSVLNSETGRLISNNVEIEKTDKAISRGRIYGKISRRLADGTLVVLVCFKNSLNKDRPYQYYHYLISKGPSVVEHNFDSNVDYFSSSRLSEMSSILSYNYLNSSKYSGVKK